MLRDVDGLSGHEVCEALNISEANQKGPSAPWAKPDTPDDRRRARRRPMILGLRKELACQEIVEIITDYLENALSRSQRRRFEAHLAGASTVRSTWHR